VSINGYYIDKCKCVNGFQELTQGERI
jgi:hypothetical protein